MFVVVVVFLLLLFHLYFPFSSIIFLIFLLLLLHFVSSVPFPSPPPTSPFSVPLIPSLPPPHFHTPPSFPLASVTYLSSFSSLSSSCSVYYLFLSFLNSTTYSSSSIYCSTPAENLCNTSSPHLHPLPPFLLPPHHYLVVCRFTLYGLLPLFTHLEIRQWTGRTGEWNEPRSHTKAQTLSLSLPLSRTQPTTHTPSHLQWLEFIAACLLPYFFTLQNYFIIMSLKGNPQLFLTNIYTSVQQQMVSSR